MNKEEIGNEGERIARDHILSVIRYFKDKVTVYNNVIFEFPSVFGDSPNGLFTTEIDHIIVTPYLIVLVETKNEQFCKCGIEEDTWLLVNGDEAANPIRQNHIHKMVFCDLMGVDPRKVFTIELLLENQSDVKSDYFNDYIMNEAGFEDNLLLLLSTRYDEILDPKIKELLLKHERNSQSLKNKHVENLERANDITKWIKTHENTYIFSFLDTVKCTKCDANLVFRESKYVDYSRGNTRKSKQYMLGCLNYSRIKCNERFYYSKERGKGFQAVVRTSFEERTGWKELEETTMNKLDEFNQLKIDNIELKNEIDRKEKELNYYKNKCEKIRAEKDEIFSKYEDQRIAFDDVRSKQKSFIKLVGKLYIKK